MTRSVLIVDDSEFVRNYHSAILRDARFQVITAGDGVEALEKLFTHRCDLVLTDINMQRMDGYEFIRTLRETPEYRETGIPNSRKGRSPRRWLFAERPATIRMHPFSANVYGIRLPMV